MAKASQENGKKGESILEDWFHKRGYWAHLIKRNLSGGQPLDAIVCKGNKKYVLCWYLDAKYVNFRKGGRFDFDDIQPNQLTAMKYLISVANVPLSNVGFFIVFEGFEEEPRFLNYGYLVKLMGTGAKSIRMEHLQYMRRVEEELWKAHYLAE